MSKPPYATTMVGDITTDCWKVNPKERPTITQLEETLSDQLETGVKDYYLQLNDPYPKMNVESKNSNPSASSISKMLDTEYDIYTQHQRKTALSNSNVHHEPKAR